MVDSGTHGGWGRGWGGWLVDLVLKLGEGLKTGKGVHMNRGIGPGIMGLGGKRDRKGWGGRWGWRWDSGIGVGERLGDGVDRARERVRYSHSVIGPVCRGFGFGFEDGGGGATLLFII